MVSWLTALSGLPVHAVESKRVIKIGIVDSGIARAFLQMHPVSLASAANIYINYRKKTIESFHYDRADIDRWCRNEVDLDVEDTGGHGTAVASIIYRHSKRPVELHVARILDEWASGHVLCLLEAVRWLVEEVRPDYINLSLGTTNENVRDRMAAHVSQADAQGCRIFAAAASIPTLPSELDGVTAVGTPQLAGSSTARPKLDRVAIPSTITVFEQSSWVEREMVTSYACPFTLAQAINER